jgi:hypothetical protein
MFANSWKNLPDASAFSPQFTRLISIRFASMQSVANFPALQLKGWAAAVTTVFATVRAAFGTMDVTQQSCKGEAKEQIGSRLPRWANAIKLLA